MLGYQTFGSGARRVVVLNDWLSDTSSWDGARSYLDGDRFTYAFVDLRGYGRSKGSAGQYTVREGAADVLAFADHLEWRRFSVVGHSMSTLIALHLAQEHAERLERVALLAAVPPAGLRADERVLAFLRGMARGSDAVRIDGLKLTWGDRLSQRWLQFKAERWRASATPEAAEAYALMFARDGLPDPERRVTVPVLAVTGEQDGEPMRSAPMRGFLSPITEQLSIVPFTDCGHYPMQEAPPLLVTVLEQFLSR